MNPTDVERAFLGAVLSGAPMDDLTDELQARDFYQPKHGAIWDAMLAVHRDGNKPDIHLVAKALGPEAVRNGGPMYLVELTSVDVAPMTGQAAQYAAQVLEGALSRRLVDAATRIRQEAEVTTDAKATAETARALIDEAAAHGINEAAGMSAGALVEETINALEGDVDPGISTPWLDLDADVNGLRPGQLVIIGARPSVGKSVLAANIAAHACQSGLGVHFASLEMTRGEVMSRLLASNATVSLANIIGHKLTDEDWSRVARKSNAIREWPLWVDDTPQQTLLQLRARARTTARRTGLGLLVVDYLQLMAPRDRRVPREQQVGELSEGLKNLAKELGVPVVALAQLNRGSAERQDKRPVMSDLRESGRIEADADHIWLLHRQDMVDPKSTTGELELHIAKNRNGPTGKTVRLSFQGHYSRAVSMAWHPAGAIA